MGGNFSSCLEATYSRKIVFCIDKKMECLKRDEKVEEIFVGRMEVCVKSLLGVYRELFKFLGKCRGMFGFSIYY